MFVRQAGQSEFNPQNPCKMPSLMVSTWNPSPGEAGRRMPGAPCQPALPSNKFQVMERPYGINKPTKDWEKDWPIYLHAHTHASVSAQRHNNMTDRAGFCQMNCAYWMIRDADSITGWGVKFLQCHFPLAVMKRARCWCNVIGSGIMRNPLLFLFP